MTRARKGGIKVVTTWDDIQNKPELSGEPTTFEALDANGDVGTGASQVAKGDHDHDIGNQVLIFENALV